MSSQQEEDRPLTKAERKEIAGYKKIIAFHDLVISGKHPTIKPTFEQIARAGGLPKPLGSTPASASVGSGPKTSQLFQHPPASLNGAQRMLDQVANGSLSIDATIQSMSKQAPHRNPSHPHFTNPTDPKVSINASRSNSSPQCATPSQATLGSAVQSAPQPQAIPSQKRDLPSRKDVAKFLQPSQRSTPPPPPEIPNSNIPDTSQANTSVINYARDYYQDLGVSRDATKTALFNGLRSANQISQVQKEAYDILSDDYLRHVYDDARAYSFNLASSLDEVTGFKKVPELELEKEPFDLSVDYYKVLGVQAGGTTTSESLKRAFNHKAGLTNPSSHAFRRNKDSTGEEDDQSKWARLQEAYIVLSNYKLRKEYDAGRGIPLHYRGPVGNSKGRPNRRRK